MRYKVGDIVMDSDMRLYEIVEVERIGTEKYYYEIKGWVSGIRNRWEVTYLEDRFISYNLYVRNKKLESLGI